MSFERISIKEFLDLLLKYPENSEICFETNRIGPQGEGTAWEFQDITERRINTEINLIIIGTCSIDKYT